MSRGMRSRLGMSGSVLAIDVGKYGSNTFRNTSNGKNFQSFFSGIFGDEFTINEWEESFSNVTGTTNSGYTTQVVGVACCLWAAVRFRGTFIPCTQVEVTRIVLW